MDTVRISIPGRLGQSHASVAESAAVSCAYQAGRPSEPTAWARVAIIRDVTGREGSDLKHVEAELLAREPIFHKPEFGSRRVDYAAQTAEDYWEVGASGRVYGREGILDGLVKRGKVPGDENWMVSEIRCRELGANTYAFTYRLDQAGRLSRRITIWRHEPNGWKALYHQGTLIQAG